MKDDVARSRIAAVASGVRFNLARIKNLQESRVPALKMLADLEKRVEALEAKQWTPEEVQSETGYGSRVD